MPVYLLVSFCFAVVASVVAHGRGRNTLGWFVAGLFIGPFALIVGLLPPIPKEGQFVRCGACAEVIRADARRCRFCGVALEPVTGGRNVPSSAQER